MARVAVMAFIVHDICKGLVCPKQPVVCRAPELPDAEYVA